MQVDLEDAAQRQQAALAQDTLEVSGISALEAASGVTTPTFEDTTPGSVVGAPEDADSDREDDDYRFEDTIHPDASDEADESAADEDWPDEHVEEEPTLEERMPPERAATPDVSWQRLDSSRDADKASVRARTQTQPEGPAWDSPTESMSEDEMEFGGLESEPDEPASAMPAPDMEPPPAWDPPAPDPEMEAEPDTLPEMTIQGEDVQTSAEGIPDEPLYSPPESTGERGRFATTGEFDVQPDPLDALPPDRAHIRCDGCGAMVEPQHKFCGHCGYRFDGDDAPAAPKETPPAPAAIPDRSPTTIQLILINEDGSDGKSFGLVQGHNSVGRRGTDVIFDDDVYLNAHHADVLIDGDMVTVRDAESVNGSFIRITEPALIEHSDVFRLGQELLRYEDVKRSPAVLPAPADGTELLGGPAPEGAWGRLVQLMGPEVVGNAWLLNGRFVTLGRERGDITFPGDGYVSGRHATLTRRNGALYLEDLGSSNGTYVRIKGTAAVFDGDLLLMGQQLFRVAF